MTTANKVWKNDVYNQLKPKPPILCHKCMLWVKCDKGGFCQAKNLFTFTAQIACNDFIQGKPITIKEWEKQK